MPCILAMWAGIGVPPQQGILFGITELTLATVAGGLAYQNRFKIWLQPSGRLTRHLLTIVCVAGALLIGYLLLYDFCVIEHPLYKDKILFPLWTSGKLSRMVHKAGSRYGAVDVYGLAAVFDAISEMPGAAYAVTLGTLLVLWAPPIAGTSALALALALRYPSKRFRLSVAPGEAFEVFICYNRAEKLAVRAIAKELASRQIRFFLDENENPPGQVWTERVEAAISSAPSFAIFIGAAGVGNWQAVEIQSISEERIRRRCNVVPVFLPDTPTTTRLPMQLAGLTWVDFRLADPDPIQELERGIRAVSA